MQTSAQWLARQVDDLDSKAGCNEPTFPVVNEKADRAFAHSNSPDLECARHENPDGSNVPRSIG